MLMADGWWRWLNQNEKFENKKSNYLTFKGKL